MTDWGVFPDQEAAVIELISDLGTVDVTTPNDLQANLPFIRVGRIGGTDDRFTDAGHVDVDCFAVQRSDASALAALVHQRMLSFPHVLSDCVIDGVTTDASPNEVPWANTAIRRFTASYRVTARRSL